MSKSSHLFTNALQNRLKIYPLSLKFFTCYETSDIELPRLDTQTSYSNWLNGQPVNIIRFPNNLENMNVNTEIFEKNKKKTHSNLC